MNDAELAHRIKHGDRDAARKLVDRYYASVLRFMFTLCRCQDDAEELTQETFVRTLNQIGKFRGESGLRTWIHRIAYHEFTHRARQRKSGSISEDLKRSPFETTSVLAMDLERALDELSLEARAAFVLCEVQELSVRESATILGIPEGTVKSRVHSARKQLQKALASELEEVHHVA